MDSRHFIRFFGVHQRIFAQHAEGITHDESCRAPAGGGNSLNWVLGHIAASRDDILKLLGEEPLWSEAQVAPYDRGSAGALTPATARPLSEILAFLQFHESYHAGQVGRLRRLLGKAGVIR